MSLSCAVPGGWTKRLFCHGSALANVSSLRDGSSVAAHDVLRARLHLAGIPQFGSPFLPFVGYTIALSVVLTFLAQNTRGSVIIATLFHGAVNTVGFVNAGATPIQKGWGNPVSYGLVALVVGTAAWNRRRLPQ